MKAFSPERPSRLLKNREIGFGVVPTTLDISHRRGTV
jgi:hypothetical protein